MTVQIQAFHKKSILAKLKKHPWTAAAALVCLLLLLFPPLVCMELRINYSDPRYTQGETFKVLTSHREDTIPFSGLQATYARTGQSRIYFLDYLYRKGSYVRRLDPADTDKIPLVSIRSVEIRCNGILGGVLEGQTLYDAFTPNEQVEMALSP